MDALNQTLAEIRDKAAELRESFGDEPRARALEWAAQRIEQVIRDGADAQLSLAEAALRSGYSAAHLARLLRHGKLPNVGRHGCPRIRVADLPRRSQRNVIVDGAQTSYDPRTDARALSLEGRLGGFAHGKSQAHSR